MGLEGEGWVRVCDGGGRTEKIEEEDLGGGREEERELEVLVPTENSDRSCLTSSCSSSSEEA